VTSLMARDRPPTFTNGLWFHNGGLDDVAIFPSLSPLLTHQLERSFFQGLVLFLLIVVGWTLPRLKPFSGAPSWATGILFFRQCVTANVDVFLLKEARGSLLQSSCAMSLTTSSRLSLTSSRTSAEVLRPSEHFRLGTICLFQAFHKCPHKKEI